MYHLLSLDSSMNPRWFVTQFVLGLHDGIRAVVRIQGPTSITHAAAPARIQEEELEHHRHRAKPITLTKHPTGNVVLHQQQQQLLVRIGHAVRAMMISIENASCTIFAEPTTFASSVVINSPRNISVNVRGSCLPLK
jgi:hypothetical protein